MEWPESQKPGEKTFKKEGMLKCVKHCLKVKKDEYKEMKPLDLATWQVLVNLTRIISVEWSE